MHGSMERQYTCALNELHFSEGDRARMTQKLLNAKQAKRPPHRHLRTALAAAAACAALTATALAAAPGIREALQATGVAIDAAPMTPHALFAAFKQAGLL